MSPAIVSGIVTGDAPVSYWSIFFLSLVTVPEVFAWVNSAQFLLVSKVANVSLFYLSAVFINDAVGVTETVFVHGYQVMAAVGAHQ